MMNAAPLALRGPLPWRQTIKHITIYILRNTRNDGEFPCQKHSSQREDLFVLPFVLNIDRPSYFATYCLHFGWLHRTGFTWMYLAYITLLPAWRYTRHTVIEPYLVLLMRIDYEPITYNDDSHDGTGDNHAAESQNLMWSSFAFARTYCVLHMLPGARYVYVTNNHTRSTTLCPVPSPTQSNPAQPSPECTIRTVESLLQVNPFIWNGAANSLGTVMLLSFFHSKFNQFPNRNKFPNVPMFHQFHGPRKSLKTFLNKLS